MFERFCKLRDSLNKGLNIFFIQFKDLYSLLFAVERFTYLRDFSNFCLIDLFIQIGEILEIKIFPTGLNRFSNIRLRDFLK